MRSKGYSAGPAADHMGIDDETAAEYETAWLEQDQAKSRRVLNINIPARIDPSAVTARIAAAAADAHRFKL